MKFEIAVTNNSFDKVWTGLEMLGPKLMGDMTIASGRTADSERFIVVILEEIDDTPSLMKNLVEMANNGIHWSLKTEWWYNTDKEN